MDSSPLCTLVVYVDADEILIKDFVRDVRSFFKKIPLPYELLFLCEKNTRATSALSQLSGQGSSPQETLTLHQNTQKWGRSESLRQGLSKAQGQILIIADPTLATPLGDLFKLMQNLAGEENLDLVGGERLSKSNSPLRAPLSRRHKMEQFFNSILVERRSGVGVDPLCEALAIKKSSWEKVAPILWRQSGWYFHHDLRRAANQIALRSRDIFVHDSGRASPSFYIWRERWSLIKKSLL